jgi:hypothetical protein
MSGPFPHTEPYESGMLDWEQWASGLLGVLRESRRQARAVPARWSRFRRLGRSAAVL